MRLVDISSYVRFAVRDIGTERQVAAMKIEGLHEKELFVEKEPFRAILNKDTDFCYPLHWHNAVEVVYVIENDFTIGLNTRTYQMHAGDIAFIPSGELHEFKGVTKTGTRFFMNFELSTLSFYCNLEPILRHLRNAILVTKDDGGLYVKIRSQLRDVMNRYEHTDLLFYTARMIDILLLFGKKDSDQINHANFTDVRRKSMDIDKISKSLEYIEKNYREDIFLKDIASAGGFSEYYFSRLFKQIAEKSFRQYLNEFRINKARALLITNCSVSQAAYASGFSSLTTFGRLFRSINGCSPQEFQKLEKSSI